MKFCSVLILPLCVSATLKRSFEDVSDIENASASKLLKTEAVPVDVWQIVLSSGNFEFAPQLSSVTKSLQTVVSQNVYTYLMEAIKTDKMLDEQRILGMIPLFLSHLKTLQNDTDSPAVFTYFFKHAKSHDSSSKIFSAWKSLGLRFADDRALLTALNESIGIPSEHPVTAFLKQSRKIFLEYPYSYTYPALKLRCNDYSNLIWKRLFHMMLRRKHFELTRHGPADDILQNFTVNVWNELYRYQQDETLEFISRTIIFYNGRSESPNFEALSAATQNLLGCSLPKISCNEITAELQSIDESSLMDMIYFGWVMKISWSSATMKYWTVRVNSVRSLYKSIASSQSALINCDFESLQDYRSWGPSKILMLSSLAMGRNRSDEFRLEIAKHVWKVPTLDGMLIFSFFIDDRPQLLARSLYDLMNASSDHSILEVLTSVHLKFIELKKIDTLHEIVHEWATRELLQIVNSYVPGQQALPLNAKLANPDLSILLVRCVRNDPVLQMKTSVDALLQTLPSLKRYL